MTVNIRLTVADAMSHTVRAARPDSTVREVAEMMREEDAGCIPVVDATGRLAGIITDRDIVLRCLAAGRMDPYEPVRWIMSAPVRTVSPQDDLESAAKVMAEHGIRRLAVVDQGRVTGVLSFGNLVQATHMGAPAHEAALGVTRGT